MGPLDRLVRSADTGGSGPAEETNGNAANPWDALSSYFDTSKAESEVNPGAADNVLIAWPALLKGIQQIQPRGAGLRALDFGCGAGGFCSKLKETGYEVAGSDSSAGMANIARQNVGSDILIYEADSKV